TANANDDLQPSRTPFGMSGPRSHHRSGVYGPGKRQKRGTWPVGSGAISVPNPTNPVPVRTQRVRYPPSTTVHDKEKTNGKENPKAKANIQTRPEGNRSATPRSLRPGETLRPGRSSQGIRPLFTLLLLCLRGLPKTGWRPPIVRLHQVTRLA